MHHVDLMHGLHACIWCVRVCRATRPFALRMRTSMTAVCSRESRQASLGSRRDSEPGRKGWRPDSKGTAVKQQGRAATAARQERMQQVVAARQPGMDGSRQMGMVGVCREARMNGCSAQHQCGNKTTLFLSVSLPSSLRPRALTL